MGVTTGYSWTGLRGLEAEVRAAGAELRPVRHAGSPHVRAVAAHMRAAHCQARKPAGARVPLEAYYCLDAGYLMSQPISLFFFAPFN